MSLHLSVVPVSSPTTRSNVNLSCDQRIRDKLRGFSLTRFLSLHGRVVDIIAACRLGFNAFCMALLVVAEGTEVTTHAERLETTVGVLELLFLLLGQNLNCICLKLLIRCVFCCFEGIRWRTFGGNALLVLHARASFHSFGRPAVVVGPIRKPDLTL